MDRSGSRAARWPAVARGVLRICARCARVIVLPLALLLFMQWPLRELVQAYSREANDLAQMLFALYVSVAVSEAMRQQAHIAADALAHRFSPRARSALARGGALLVLVPWCAYVLYAAAPLVWSSVRHAEAFGETLNPGYFFIKLAVALLAALVLLQSVLEVGWPEFAGPDQ